MAVLVAARTVTGLAACWFSFPYQDAPDTRRTSAKTAGVKLMAKVNLTTAFSRYGATLANPQWSVSAISDKGELVVSCWRHYFEFDKPVLRYTDSLSRWSGNSPGNNLMREHLNQAVTESLPVRLVIADTEETELVDTGADASSAKKSFFAKENVVGKVTKFDGDRYELEFIEYDV